MYGTVGRLRLKVFCCEIIQGPSSIDRVVGYLIHFCVVQVLRLLSSR